MTSSDSTFTPSPRRRGPIVALIVAIVVVVAAIATGVGVAIGAGSTPQSSPGGVAGGSTDPAAPASSPSASASRGGSQADDFVRARDAAEKAIDGSTATEIKREGEGWEVDVRAGADSADRDVALGADYSVTRLGDPDGAADGGDRDPLGTLSGDALGKAIDAALAAAGSGTVTSIELADTDPEAYEVKVSQNGAETTVTLGKDYSVIRTEQDD